MDVRGFSMCSRLGANAPIYLVLINTLDKNEIITYNNRTSKNRGVGMEEDKDIELKEMREILKRLEEKENEKEEEKQKLEKNYKKLLVVFSIVGILYIFGQLNRMNINRMRVNEFHEQANKRASEHEISRN